MSNTITAILPIIYRAYNQVARELTGFINHAYRNSSAAAAAVGQTVEYPIAPPATLGDITAGQLPPDDGDQTILAGTMTISKSKYSPVRWNGEEQAAISGVYNDVLQQQFAQSFRALANAVEADVAAAAIAGASRAVGTAGTTPFGTASDLSDFSLARQVIDDNGVPQSDLHIVVNSNSMANLRGKQAVLFKVNESGTDQLLRQGIIGEVQGLSIGNSAGLVKHTAGTGSGYLVNGAVAAGGTAINADTGTGTILAGDVVTATGDTNKYVVNSALSGGAFSIGNPGARAAIADNTALTLGASYTPNVIFQRMALHLITRAPFMPQGGDIAVDVHDLVDPVTGLVFQIALYRLYRRIRFEIGLAWGVKAVNSEFIGLLMG